MEFTVPDTLVLKIVEYDSSSDIDDTTLYVWYDQNINRYVIRGKRRENPRLWSSCVYSFECDSVTNLADFIQFVIDETNEVSYILYNYDSLLQTSNEITFEFLSQNDDMTYEIAGYDNQELKRKSLVRNLKMLKHIFNYNN
jgi:hypothetical protein